MAAMSDYLEVELLNAVLRGTSYTGGAVYLALHTADPTDSSTANEITDSAYTRQQMHSASVSDGFTVPHATGGYVTNDNVITFPAVADGSVTITHMSLWTASSGGNMLMHGALSPAKTLAVSDTITFPQNEITITLS